MIANSGDVLGSDAGVGRLLGKVVGGLACGQRHDQVGILSFDAFDDAGKVLGTDVDAEGDGVDAGICKEPGGVFGGGDAVVGVFGQEDNLFEV